VDEAATDAEAERMILRILEAEEHFRLGDAAVRRGHFSVALDELAKAIELNPEEAEHHALHAWAVWSSTPDKAAVARQVKRGLQKAMTMSQMCLPAYLYRGLVAKQQGDDETAEQCFMKVLSLRDDHAVAQLELRLLEGRKTQRGLKKPASTGGLLDRLRKK
jgi:tetratricopeptide (TPR) repeat protein